MYLGMYADRYALLPTKGHGDLDLVQYKLYILQQETKRTERENNRTHLTLDSYYVPPRWTPPTCRSWTLKVHQWHRAYLHTALPLSLTLSHPLLFPHTYLCRAGLDRRIEAYMYAVNCLFRERRKKVKFSRDLKSSKSNSRSQDGLGW